MTYTPDFLTYLISHYTERLTTERERGNTKAVAFLREQLHNLKQVQ